MAGDGANGDGEGEGDEDEARRATSAAHDGAARNGANTEKQNTDYR